VDVEMFAGTKIEKSQGLAEESKGECKSVKTGALDPFSLCQVAAGLGHPIFFFETSGGLDGQAVQSVLGIGPFEIFNAARGKTFEALARVSAVPRPESEKSSTQGAIPYRKGGVFGCVGYDCITEIEPSLSAHGYFAKLNTLTELNSAAHLFIAHDLLVFDHLAGDLHLISARPGASKMATIEQLVEEGRRLQNTQEQKTQTLSESDGTEAKLPPLEIAPGRLQPVLGENDYLAGVARLKEHIKCGDIFQAVLAETFECQTEVTGLEIFRSLREVSQTPYSFYFSFSGREFFGASPEALVRVEGRKISTHPIAGTRARGVDKASDQRLQRQLVRSSKEAAEHLMLVDLARNDLGRVAVPGTVQVTSFRAIQRLSNVMHLASRVEATLAPGHGAVDAFKSCFPAGTLSGAPKIRAMGILAEIETVPRGFYGGAVVALDFQGSFDACIAIRSLELCAGKALLRAGAGIVADSSARAEYQEVRDKLKPLRQAIARAEQASKNHCHTAGGCDDSAD
jgi:anthranilate synthase component 1